MSGRILVIDDEKLIRWSIRDRLQTEGHQVAEAPTCAEAERLAAAQPYDLALIDLRLPDGSGVDLMRSIQRQQPGLPAIIITAYSTVSSAVAAIKEGAYDYIGKPFDMDTLCATVNRALEMQALRSTLDAELGLKRQQFGVDSLVGEAAAFRAVKNLVRRVAASESTTVLLLGETGCGKDMAARAIHYESARAARPFMNITCTAMPESLVESELFGHEEGAFTSAKGRKKGLFELAHGGTVFLDEVGDMPLDLQPKLLRVLEEKRFRRVGGAQDIGVDCRIIAATNRDPAKLIGEGKFREDLYYRLNTLPIMIPPLRERPEDVAVLARNFLALFGQALGRTGIAFKADALDKLLAHPWPGNVRELRNVIERAVLLSQEEQLGAGDLLFGPTVSSPADASEAGFHLPPAGCSLDDVESSLIRQALARTQGNQTKAAQLLGITRDQIRYKIEKHGLAR